MLPRIYPDRFQVAFGDHRLVADAGLILPVTLAQHLGLRELVDNHVDLGDAPGRANTGDKMLPLVASALAGGDCIDDADVLRTGRVDGASAAWSRRHPPWGRSCAASDGAMSVSWIGVSRELPARVWSAGAGPGDGPLTIDPDSTVGETYPLTGVFHAATGPPYNVGVSPEGVIGNAQSIQRDRPTAGRHQ